MKHKPLCWIVSLLVFIGALNWGLVGIGGFLNMDLDLVNMALGTWPLVANIVYVLVGLAGVAFIVNFFRCPDCCGCNTCGTKKEEKPAEPAQPTMPAETPAEPEAPAEGVQQ